MRSASNPDPLNHSRHPGDPSAIRRPTQPKIWMKQVEVSDPPFPSFISPSLPSMLTIQFCVLVVEQGTAFLDNLATLDLPSSSSPFSTKDIFEQTTQILPNSIIGRHLKYVNVREVCLTIDMWKDEWRRCWTPLRRRAWNPYRMKEERE